MQPKMMLPLKMRKLYESGGRGGTVCLPIILLARQKLAELTFLKQISTLFQSHY